MWLFSVGLAQLSQSPAGLSLSNQGSCLFKWSVSPLHSTILISETLAFDQRYEKSSAVLAPQQSVQPPSKPVREVEMWGGSASCQQEHQQALWIPDPLIYRGNGLAAPSLNSTLLSASGQLHQHVQKRGHQPGLYPTCLWITYTQRGTRRDCNCPVPFMEGARGKALGVCPGLRHKMAPSVANTH